MHIGNFCCRDDQWGTEHLAIIEKLVMKTDLAFDVNVPLYSVNKAGILYDY